MKRDIISNFLLIIFLFIIAMNTLKFTTSLKSNASEKKKYLLFKTHLKLKENDDNQNKLLNIKENIQYKNKLKYVTRKTESDKSNDKNDKDLPQNVIQNPLFAVSSLKNKYEQKNKKMKTEENESSILQSNMKFMKPLKFYRKSNLIHSDDDEIIKNSTQKSFNKYENIHQNIFKNEIDNPNIVFTLNDTNITPFSLTQENLGVNINITSQEINNHEFEIDVTSSYKVVEEMYLNHDQRKMKRDYLMILLITLVLCVISSIAMLLTWNKTKFPAFLLQNIFCSFLFITFAQILLVTSENIYLYQKFLYGVIFFADLYQKIYLCAFVYAIVYLNSNFSDKNNKETAVESKNYNLYDRFIKFIFGKLNLKTNEEKTTELTSPSISNINTLKDKIFRILTTSETLLFIAFLFYNFFFKIRIKQCFSGCCLAKPLNKYIIEIIPGCLEFLILSILLLKEILSYLLNNFKSKFSFKVCFAVFLLISWNFINYYSKILKLKNFSDFRMEDYFSFHDLYFIIKFYIFFAIFILNNQVFMQIKSSIFKVKEDYFSDSDLKTLYKLTKLMSNTPKK